NPPAPLTAGFLYSDGALADLNDLLPDGSGWTITEAYGINDAGQIAGAGFNPEGQSHAFVLTPDGGRPRAPEPRAATVRTAVPNSVPAAAPQRQAKDLLFGGQTGGPESLAGVGFLGPATLEEKSLHSS